MKKTFRHVSIIISILLALAFSSLQFTPAGATGSVVDICDETHLNSYLLPTSFQEVENTVDCSNQSKRNRKT